MEQPSSNRVPCYLLVGFLLRCYYHTLVRTTGNGARTRRAVLCAVVLRIGPSDLAIRPTVTGLFRAIGNWPRVRKAFNTFNVQRMHQHTWSATRHLPLGAREPRSGVGADERQILIRCSQLSGIGNDEVAL